MKMSQVWTRLAEVFRTRNASRVARGICMEVAYIGVPYAHVNRVRQTIRKTRQSLYGLYGYQVAYLWELDERGMKLRRLYCLNQAAKARKAEAKARKSKRR